MTEEDRMLDVPEVARRLGIQEEAVRRGMRAGRIPGFQPTGGPWRVKESDFTAFINSRPTRKRKTKK